VYPSIHARSRTVHTTLRGSLDREEQGGAGGCGGSADEEGSGAAYESDRSESGVGGTQRAHRSWR